MSRRSHHGGRHHGRPHRPVERRHAAPSTLAQGAQPEAAALAPVEESFEPEMDTPVAAARSEVVDAPAVEVAAAADVEMPEPEAPVGPEPVAFERPTNGAPHADGMAGTCTAPQLRRFIKSRAYVPMHELRRRFAINGSEDDVTQVDVDARRIYIGLPEREGRMLGELLRGGDVGFELSLDPITPIVVGVYPMRPVPRP